MTDQRTVERIREAAKERGVTQAALAKLAGMPSQSAMSNVLNGTRRLQPNEAKILLAFLGLDQDQNVQWIPLIGLASAGSWNEAIQMPKWEFPIPKRVAGQRAFGVEIVGDSMNKILPEGGWAVVDPDQTSLYSGRVYLVENGDADVTVKRYMSDPARLVPVSDNDTHKEIDLSATPYRVIGRVVAYGNNEGL